MGSIGCLRKGTVVNPSSSPLSASPLVDPAGGVTGMSTSLSKLISKSSPHQETTVY